MLRASSVALVLTVLAACASARAESTPAVELSTVSSRPDTVSGGDVLVRLKAPAGSRWMALLNGRDVTTSFGRTAPSGELLALLNGLAEGKNTLTIRIGGVTASTLQIANHPGSGPVFSGPHQQPFICQTIEAGLGPPLDANCSAHTVVRYYYKTTAPRGTGVMAILAPHPAGPDAFAPGFKAYDPAAPVPTDVARTTTSDGRVVPYVVRREVGTLNRAVYEIQFLHQPGEPLPAPWTRPTSGWNGRLVYLFDGGCGAGYRQGALEGAVGAANQAFLARGYATATSTLNVFGNNCNDRISAETLSMVKEHFIEQFGEPVHTIGWGGSGGAMAQYLVAQNYPGLLDGIVSFVTFPDFASTAQSVTDCALLDRAFSTSQHRWSEEEKTAVAGFAMWRTCSHWLGWGITDAQTFCDPLVPAALIYDPTSRPKGIRCDVYDNEINVLGVDPSTGFARRPLDNVGVQYGLGALATGKIDMEQFIDLNERVGGLDADGRLAPARTQSTAETVRIAYERGFIVTGGGGLSEIPILDWRPYADDMADGHDRFRSLALRARLLAANASAANQVILTYPRYSTYLDLMHYAASHRWEVVFQERAGSLLAQMDRWLDNVSADKGEGGPSAKVARSRPADLADGCWAADGEHIVEPATQDGSGRCNQIYPPHADPRRVAGAPLSDDVLKCELKPIEPADYPQPLTPRQIERLEAIFPSGVCDYTRPGVGQQRAVTPWQKY